MVVPILLVSRFNKFPLMFNILLEKNVEKLQLKIKQKFKLTIKI